jgi:maltose phosphorylase
MINKHLRTDSWNIINDKFDLETQESFESLFSIGNGHMGQRGNFEEFYSGESSFGNFVAGIYYPDPTKVGWWKNGYPDYFAKLINAPNWLDIEINIGTTESVNLAINKIISFKRVLNMREGYFERDFVIELRDGKQIRVRAKRFLSILDKEVGAIRYSVTPLNFSGEILFTVAINADVKNDGSYYNEDFWTVLERSAGPDEAYVATLSKKTFFYLCTATKFSIYQNGEKVRFFPEIINSEKYVASIVKIHCPENVETTIYKYAAVVSSLNEDPVHLGAFSKKLVNDAWRIGYDFLFEEHAKVWQEKWDKYDITIDGDMAAQQAIRFNIFQLIQSYTGDDPRLNVGPKGFTGEKYGGGTYWDTEAYCLPFYMCVVGANVAKNLLLYRYKHLDKAIENAQKLGFTNGAALYPVFTMNGEECHNEWEITFEEIHRNAAIAHAIYNYVNYTNDYDYLAEYGLEVLMAISRFWSQRVTFSADKNKYVILGVTGPNEYENNVNNNWYTNKMAVWTLQYTIDSIEYCKKNYRRKYKILAEKIKLIEADEVGRWQDIVKNMYFPEDQKLGIFLQQDGYLDKELIPAKELDPKERPLHRHWSWDRILRSCYIKQADVVQGLYFLEDQLDIETIRRNFDFYEQFAVHESSLSPSIHALVAARLGYVEKAYELYMRASRFDLDDYSGEVKEGCHVTSMGGAWLALIHGFGGMRLINNRLSFDPVLPSKWKRLSFKVTFRGNLLSITIKKGKFEIVNEGDSAVNIMVKGKKYSIGGTQKQLVNL